MAIYLTADTHFYHDNIIKYCNRPYNSVDDMNEDLIKRWNSLVSYHDTVYHLGDFVWSNNVNDPSKFLSIINRLNGKVTLIRGNHDSKKLMGKVKGLVSPMKLEIMDYSEIVYRDRKVVLMHYPIQCWNADSHGSIHLHGHCHGRLKPTNQRYDVGVDCNEYRPVAIEDIMKKISHFSRHEIKERG